MGLDGTLFRLAAITAFRMNRGKLLIFFGAPPLEAVVLAECSPTDETMMASILEEFIGLLKEDEARRLKL